MDNSIIIKKNAIHDISRYRWIVLFTALVIMMIISIYQYSWSLFAYSLKEELNWDLAKISIIFSVFAYTATFIQPFSGLVADSYGARKIAVLGSFLAGTGFVLSSSASSVMQLCFYYGFGGLGVGILYGVSTACAIKWFPDRRGFAVGLIVFGFGAGTAIFNWIIQGLLESVGVHRTFFLLGLCMVVILIPISAIIKYPPDELVSSSDSESLKDIMSSHYKPFEMLKTYQWFLIYFCFIFTVSIVLMFGAQIKMLAKEFNLSQNYFSLLLIIFPLGNGLSRVVAGAVSDKIGREKTMVIFFGLLGLSILCLVFFGHIPSLFVAFVFTSALLGGSPFALYPATIGDYYGAKHSTTNYGITYTAKAWAGLISGWLSAYLVAQFGSYKLPLVIIAVCSLIAAIMSFPKWMKAPSQ